MFIPTINGKREHESEKEQEGEYGQVWGGEKEDGNDIIIISNQKK